MLINDLLHFPLDVSRHPWLNGPTTNEGIRDDERTNERTTVGEDLDITEVTPQGLGGLGTWVCGTVGGYRFTALAYADHAEVPEYEIGDSRISKLWVQRLADKKLVFNWDRGSDVPAADATVQAVVELICEGAAECACGH